jgi:hypothetical protein
MKPPHPTAIRLATRASGGPLPAPPFGLRVWTNDAAAIAVWIDATIADVRDPGEIALQLPDPALVAPGTTVVVLGVAARRQRDWRRFLPARQVAVTRQTRCEALLARGYVDIGGASLTAAGGDLAWGFASR